MPHHRIQQGSAQGCARPRQQGPPGQMLFVMTHQLISFRPNQRPLLALAGGCGRGCGLIRAECLPIWNGVLLTMSSTSVRPAVVVLRDVAGELAHASERRNSRCRRPSANNQCSFRRRSRRTGPPRPSSASRNAFRAGDGRAVERDSSSLMSRRRPPSFLVALAMHRIVRVRTPQGIMRMALAHTGVLPLLLHPSRSAVCLAPACSPERNDVGRLRRAAAPRQGSRAPSPTAARPTAVGVRCDRQDAPHSPQPEPPLVGHVTRRKWLRRRLPFLVAGEPFVE